MNPNSYPFVPREKLDENDIYCSICNPSICNVGSCSFYQKNQLNKIIKKFDYKITGHKKIILVLPCSKVKPYKNSQTHTYINYILRNNLDIEQLKQIQIFTISEVLGLVPENLEEKIFHPNSKYFYDSYPKESNIKFCQDSLNEFIQQNPDLIYLSYCTSKIFRKITSMDKINLFPKEFNSKSSLFEFRKRENVMELINFIKEVLN